MVGWAGRAPLGWETEDADVKVVEGGRVDGKTPPYHRRVCAVGSGLGPSVGLGPRNRVRGGGTSKGEGG